MTLEQKELTVEEQVSLLKQQLNEVRQQLVHALGYNQQLQILNEVMTEQRSELMNQATELMVAIKTNNMASKSNEDHASATNKALQDTIKTLSDTVTKISGVTDEAKLKFRCCGWYVDFITRLPVRFLEYVPWLTGVDSIVSYYQAIKVRDQRILSQDWSVASNKERTEFIESVLKDLMPIYANSDKAIPLIEFFSDRHNDYDEYISRKEQEQKQEQEPPRKKGKKSKFEVKTTTQEGSDLMSEIDSALANAAPKTEPNDNNDQYNLSA